MDDRSYSCTCAVPDGEEASLEVVCDAGGGKVFVWLEPGMHPDAVVAFYRLCKAGAIAAESWQTFQPGADVTPSPDDHRASLGAIEVLTGGTYAVDVRLFTGDETVEMPSLTIDVDEAAVDEARQKAGEAFSESFRELFRKFFDGTQTERDSREFFDGFSEDDLDHLFTAVRDLGGPEHHAEDDVADVRGFFEFIDFVAALAHFYGEVAAEKLKNHPDSPTSQHYIHYVRKYASDDRFLDGILEKYPYCAGADR